MSLNRRLLLIIAITAFGIVLNKCEVAVQFKRFSCIVHSPTHFQDMKCWTKLINRTTTLINLNGTIIRQLDNVSLRVQMFKKAEVEYKPFLINFAQNFCEYFTKNRASKLMRLIFGLYLPYSNLNHTCPYLGHVFISNFPLDPRKLEAFWISGSYRLDVLCITDTKKLITMQFYMEFQEHEPLN